nr:PssD/Cps14F family polysaccharide biosynthesis glycosyltransferase [uncultured Blautia sp.]
MKKKKLNHKKICFAASSGGHYEQLLMLKPLMEQYDSFIVTEKTSYNTEVDQIKSYYLHQVNRKELFFFFWLVVNSIKSLQIIIKERPDYIITTGVLAMIPLCLLVKITGGKLIYIESFAKVNSGTETGKFLYRFADQFYVQWESMKEIYPKALFRGGIY